MFNVSIGDRLKAAVNQLEATGTSLQARASASLQQPGQGPGAPASQAQTAPVSPSIEKPGSPSLAVSPRLAASASTDAVATSTSNPTSPNPNINTNPAPSTSPTRTYSAAHLADSALSGLTGLRRSFNFRPSQDGGRPSSAQLAQAHAQTQASGADADGKAAHGQGQQELKDMPSPSTSTSLNISGTAAGTGAGAGAGAGAGPSRSASPARFLGGASFGIGSDPSTAVATPHAPRSPGPTGLGLSRLRSPALPPADIDPQYPLPDPSDPATYPLPPSPGPVTASLAAPVPRYADPLGASPLLGPASDAEPPSLDVEGATPEATDVPEVQLTGEEKRLATEADAELLAAEKALEAVDNGEVPEAAAPAEEQSSNGLATEQNALQRQIDAANKLVRELTPLEGGIADTEALEGWIKMMKGKVEVMGEEMTRLRGQITLQESRIEELRDTHRLEGTSQSGLIAKLRTQLSTAESNLAVRVAELSTMADTKVELSRAQTQVKEEEEKRSKAIQLLKTVRLKLVKAEKDKEEVERDRAEERAERSRAQDETERVRAEKEREVSALRRGFERELAGVKERAEKEMKERKAAWELEMITTKASHARDLSNKTTMVHGLEEIVKELSKTKDEQFHTIQARQAEAEAARAESEGLENRTKELEFQLREANERITMLEDAPVPSSSSRGRANGILDGGRFSSSPSPSPSRANSGPGSGSGRGPGPTPAEVQRVVAEAEARAESKLSDLRTRIRALERERNELEEEWGVKVQERVREVEGLKRRIVEMQAECEASAGKVREAEARTDEGVERRKGLEKEISGLKAQLEEMREDVATAQDAERLVKDELAQNMLQTQLLGNQVEEQKTLVANLRQANKTLREELRKVQSSVQLMERSRNPGVGYWSAANHSHGQGQGQGQGQGPAGSMQRKPSVSGGASGEVTPGTERQSLDSVRTDGTKRTGAGGGGGGGGGGGVVKGAGGVVENGANEEEEVNLEYLRNVILQFLENPHMRRQLVQVLSVILHFTPQELRRLNAKITA